MKHKDKVKMARKMRTHKEMVEGVALFNSAEWNRRFQAIHSTASNVDISQMIAKKDFTPLTWYQRLKIWFLNLFY